MKLLDGKNAIVTGSSRGIGKAIAIKFAKGGASVAVNCSKTIQDAKKVAEKIESLGEKSLVIRANVSKRREVKHMIDRAKERFGRLDILVNCAGISTKGPLEDLSEENWDRVMDVNLKGTFLCSKYAAKEMIEQRDGVIMNIASISGMTPEIYTGAYTSSKAGVIGLTKLMAVEWAKYGIRANAICPGPISTKLQEELYPASQRKVRAKAVPLSRYGTPAEVAEAALFLASEKSSYITGETLVLDGGSQSSMFYLVKKLKEESQT